MNSAIVMQWFALLEIMLFHSLCAKPLAALVNAESCCRCLKFIINIARFCQYIVEQDLLGMVSLPFNVVDSTSRRDILPTLK